MTIILKKPGDPVFVSELPPYKPPVTLVGKPGPPVKETRIEKHIKLGDPVFSADGPAKTVSPTTGDPTFSVASPTQSITVRLPDGSEKTHSCEKFENVAGELQIHDGNSITTYGPGEWAGWREVKDAPVSPAQGAESVQPLL